MKNLREHADLRKADLNPPSQVLMAAFEGHPLERLASSFMERADDGSWNAVVVIPSPTGEGRRNLGLWLDESGVPSLEFGAWHTHSDLWDDDPKIGLKTMLSYLQRISLGKVQPAGFPLTPDGLPFCVLDLEDEQKLLDEVTRPGAPKEVKLLSWSGGEDQTISIEKFGKRGEPA